VTRLDAVVLAGGEGTRLRPLTYDIPKQLLPVAGLTMLERVLESLAAGGVVDAVVSLGYLPTAFKEAFPEARAAGVSLTYVVEDEPLGTGGAVAFAAREAGLWGRRLVVRNGDVVTDMDLGLLVEAHERMGGAATIALVEVEDASRYGVVQTDPDGRVRSFVEKPVGLPGRSACINAGTYVMEPEAISFIPQGRAVSIEREVFPELASRGLLYAWTVRGYWVDAGTPSSYLAANLDLLRGSLSLALPAGAKPAGPGVWVLPECRIDAAILEQVLVGRGSQLQDRARVEGAVIGSNCWLGSGVTVRRSVLMDGVVVEDGAVVEDSIVGPAVVVGRRARLAEGSVVGGNVHVEAGSDFRGVCIGRQGLQ
jgi:mannose-1-phosphate guanylyltransferase